jgi:hypothetical protein
MDFAGELAHLFPQVADALGQAKVSLLALRKHEIPGLLMRIRHGIPHTCPVKVPLETGIFEAHELTNEVLFSTCSETALWCSVRIGRKLRQVAGIVAVPVGATGYRQRSDILGTS